MARQETGQSFFYQKRNMLIFLIYSRRRLIGIAVLTSVVTSDVLYHATSEFASQVSTIIPGILYTLKEADIDVLKDE